MDRFDPETGQVYRETIVHQLRRRQESRYLSPLGAASLIDIALRHVVRRARALTPETLRQTPQHYVEMIWKAVRREGQETLHIWKTFIRAGVVDGTAFPYFTKSKPVVMPLVQYLLSVTCANTSWLVNLELCDLDCSVLELRTVACLDNLETLLVRYTRPTTPGNNKFNNSVIENLAFCAAREGKLQHLRMLFIQNAQDVSNAVFSVIGQFPALEVFCVFGTSIRPKQMVAEIHGWKKQDGLHTLLYGARTVEHANSYFTPRHQATVYEMVKVYIQRRHSQDARVPPILDCIIGYPRVSKPANQSSGDELVFTRDRSASFGVPAQNGAAETKDETPDLGLPNKKRKLTPKIRESRMIDFNGMLDGL